MDVALREENKAKNWILPFYWNSKDDASALYNSNGALGHIELSKDLPEGTFTSDNTDKEYDLDPKVSGKIKIEGIAQDDTLLRDIYVQFNKVMGNGTGSLGSANKVIASYDASSSTWATNSPLGANNAIDTTKGWAAAVKKATYGDLLKVGIITQLPEDKEATDTVKYTSQEYGHVVHWILYVDTAILRDASSVIGADKDVKVTATATDRGTPKWSTTGNGPVFGANTAEVTNASVTQSGGTDGSTGKDKLSGYYQMDVVPYITGITTELSAGSKNFPTTLSRSALGEYPVRRGSSVTVDGFNLRGTNTDIKVNGVSIVASKKANATNNGVTLTLDNAAVASGSTLSSGGVVAFVNSVSSLNNQTSKKITTGTGDNATTRKVEYNTEPNGLNNDELTDNRVIHFVDVTTTTDINDKRMLDMAINGSKLNFSMGYKDSYMSVATNISGTSTSIGTPKNLRGSYTRYFDNAIAINESGTLFTVSACGDTYNAPVTQWSDGPSHFALTRGTSTDGWSYDRNEYTNFYSIICI